VAIQEGGGGVLGPQRPWLEEEAARVDEPLRVRRGDEAHARMLHRELARRVRGEHGGEQQRSDHDVPTSSSASRALFTRRRR
jgi:hypothetical protein